MTLTIDQVLAGVDPLATAVEAADAQAAGCSGVFVAEAAHDPFLPLVPAAVSGGSIQLGTAIAIAFARTPMTLANIGHDLQVMSGGRFILGLGSQIRPHITNRFGMPWSEPAKRMKEFVLALHAIWRAWNDGAPLQFEGEFYRHTLMTPMFTPPPSPNGAPKVYLAGVGPRMTHVAGEVADGLFVHPFTSPDYFREQTRPALDAGLRSAGRDALDVGISMMVATGRDQRAIDEAAHRIRLQIGFYGSTPAYLPMLAQHGWESLQPRLNALSKAGEWQAMAELVDDDVLHTFAAVGDVDTVAATIIDRWDGVVDRVSLSAFGGDRDLVGDLTRRLLSSQAVNR